MVDFSTYKFQSFKVFASLILLSVMGECNVAKSDVHDIDIS